MILNPYSVTALRLTSYKNKYKAVGLGLGRVSPYPQTVSPVQIPTLTVTWAVRELHLVVEILRQLAGNLGSSDSNAELGLTPPLG